MSGDARLIDSYWHYYRLWRSALEAEIKARQGAEVLAQRVLDARAMLRKEGLWDNERDTPYLRDLASTSPATSAGTSSGRVPTTRSGAGLPPT